MGLLKGVQEDITMMSGNEEEKGIIWNRALSYMLMRARTTCEPTEYSPIEYPHVVVQAHTETSAKRLVV